MSEFPSTLRYASTHEWVRVEADGDLAVGISDHAQRELGDVVYVELPKAGQRLDAGAVAAVIESVKAASDIYAPLGGTVVAINAALADAPERVNEQPYQEGWLFRLRPDSPELPASLMEADAYRRLCEGEEGADPG